MQAHAHPPTSVLQARLLGVSRGQLNSDPFCCPPPSIISLRTKGGEVVRECTNREARVRKREDNDTPGYTSRSPTSTVTDCSTVTDQFPSRRRCLVSCDSRTAPSPAQKAGEYPLSLKQIRSLPPPLESFTRPHPPSHSQASLHITSRTDMRMTKAATAALNAWRLWRHRCSPLLRSVAVFAVAARARHPISHRRRRGRRRRAPLPAAPSSPAACGG